MYKAAVRQLSASTTQGDLAQQAVLLKTRATKPLGNM